MGTGKILIIEDERQIARFLELELLHEGYRVDVEFDGRLGLNKVEEGLYDLILLDIMLPGLNGMEVCRRIRQFSDVPVIMLTAKDDVTDKVMGLDLGADDYVTKPFAIEEVLARIRAAMRKKVESNPVSKVYKAGSLIMDTSKYQVSREGINIELTKKEFDLLEYLVKNRNIVLTREQIMENVWGYNYEGDTNVIDVYIKYLRSKIDEPFGTKLIRTIRGVGYTLGEEKN